MWNALVISLTIASTNGFLHGSLRQSSTRNCFQHPKLSSVSPNGRSCTILHMSDEAETKVDATISVSEPEISVPKAAKQVPESKPIIKKAASSDSSSTLLDYIASLNPFKYVEVTDSSSTSKAKVPSSEELPPKDKVAEELVSAVKTSEPETLNGIADVIESNEIMKGKDSPISEISTREIMEEKVVSETKVEADSTTVEELKKDTVVKPEQLKVALESDISIKESVKPSSEVKSDEDSEEKIDKIAPEKIQRPKVTAKAIPAPIEKPIAVISEIKSDLNPTIEKPIIVKSEVKSDLKPSIPPPIVTPKIEAKPAPVKIEKPKTVTEPIPEPISAAKVSEEKIPMEVPLKKKQEIVKKEEVVESNIVSDFFLNLFTPKGPSAVKDPNTDPNLPKKVFADYSGKDLPPVDEKELDSIIGKQGGVLNEVFFKEEWLALEEKAKLTAAEKLAPTKKAEAEPALTISTSSSKDKEEAESKPFLGGVFSGLFKSKVESSPAKDEIPKINQKLETEKVVATKVKVSVTKNDANLIDEKEPKKSLNLNPFANMFAPAIYDNESPTPVSQQEILQEKLPPISKIPVQPKAPILPPPVLQETKKGASLFESLFGSSKKESMKVKEEPAVIKIQVETAVTDQPKASKIKEPKKSFMPFSNLLSTGPKESKSVDVKKKEIAKDIELPIVKVQVQPAKTKPEPVKETVSKPSLNPFANMFTAPVYDDEVIAAPAPEKTTVKPAKAEIVVAQKSSIQVNKPLFGFLAKKPAVSESLSTLPTRPSTSLKSAQVAAVKAPQKPQSAPRPTPAVLPPKSKQSGPFSMFKDDKKVKEIPKPAIAKPIAAKPSASKVTLAPKEPLVKPNFSANVVSKPTSSARAPKKMDDAFIRTVSTLLKGDRTKIRQFQTITDKFRGGLMGAQVYYTEAENLFGNDNVAKIIQPLLRNLPEQDKSRALEAIVKKMTAPKTVPVRVPEKPKAGIFGSFVAPVKKASVPVVKATGNTVLKDPYTFVKSKLSPANYELFMNRTDLFVRGGINARNYYDSLSELFGGIKAKDFDLSIENTVSVLPKSKATLLRTVYEGMKKTK